MLPWPHIAITTQLLQVSVLSDMKGPKHSEGQGLLLYFHIVLQEVQFGTRSTLVLIIRAEFKTCSEVSNYNLSLILMADFLYSKYM